MDAYGQAQSAYSAPARSQYRAVLLCNSHMRSPVASKEVPIVLEDLLFYVMVEFQLDMALGWIHVEVLLKFVPACQAPASALVSAVGPECGARKGHDNAMQNVKRTPQGNRHNEQAHSKLQEAQQAVISKAFGEFWSLVVVKAGDSAEDEGGCICEGFGSDPYRSHPRISCKRSTVCSLDIWSESCGFCQMLLLLFLSA